MKLKVNGEIFETSTSETIADLLKELGIKPVQVAVEVNLNIIKKSDYTSFRLSEGDNIEIVKFVGGGELRILNIKF